MGHLSWFIFVHSLTHLLVQPPTHRLTPSFVYNHRHTPTHFACLPNNTHGSLSRGAHSIYCVCFTPFLCWILFTHFFCNCRSLEFSIEFLFVWKRERFCVRQLAPNILNGSTSFVKGIVMCACFCILEFVFFWKYIHVSSSKWLQFLK